MAEAELEGAAKEGHDGIVSGSRRRLVWTLEEVALAQMRAGYSRQGETTPM